MFAEKFFRKTAFSRSVWITCVNCGSCNGCDSEIVSMFSPNFDGERYGIKLADSPKHADVLLITGCANKKSLEVLKNIYSQMPKPHMVIAVGTCACSEKCVTGEYSIMEDLNGVIDIGGYIAGCSPEPDEIIAGILAAVRRGYAV